MHDADLLGEQVGPLSLLDLHQQFDTNCSARIKHKKKFQCVGRLYGSTDALLSFTELAPSFPYRDVQIRRGVDVKEFYDLQAEIGR